uniref:potassium-transporting ATPase subunit KdpC n=1 Tax=Pedobacter schmidteae TaxID=2201271 RepID=UPI000EB0F205|nr:potassium-transporting ATPase subunit KdpC [Pedobacter schmidteae]
MKKYLLQSLRLTAVLMLLLCVIYPLIVAFGGGFSKGHGGGEKIIKNGKVAGYVLLGQTFSKPAYFWGRPSAVDYNTAGSGGSNKGPSNAEYLAVVSGRIDTLLKYHPYLKKVDIPADMVTASGSGLDPNISEQGAIMQIKRVAANRGLSDRAVAELVVKNTEGPLLGMFGPSRVNVLKLNLALDELKK